MGSLLVRLARPGRADGTEGDAVAIRRRLVNLAVGVGITLAELVGLAFEIENPADEPAAGPSRPCGTSSVVQ